MTHGADEVYTDYIALRRLSEVESRRRIEDRGASVVTTSSSLLTVVFLLSAVATGRSIEAAKLTSDTSLVFLLLALGSFIIAVALGVFVQTSLWKSKTTADSTLKGMFDGTSDWTGDASEARRICAYLDYEAAVSLNRGTQAKTKIIIAALLVQFLAVLFLVTSLVAEFHTRGWI